MSSDSDHDKQDSHDGHDDHAVATDVIPESSPQDMILKGVTIVSALMIWLSFGWWWLQPQADVAGHEGGEASETTQH